MWNWLRSIAQQWLEAIYFDGAAVDLRKKDALGPECQQSSVAVWAVWLISCDGAISLLAEILPVKDPRSHQETGITTRRSLLYI